MQQSKERTKRPWLRRKRILLVCFFAISAIFLWPVLTPENGIGHFRNENQRLGYIATYSNAMNELPKPTTHHDIVTSFGTVRAWEWAQPGSEKAQPVLFIPGRASGAPMWLENIPEISRHRRVIAVDTLGDAGLSVQTKPFKSAADHDVWLDALISKLSTGKVDLVGHSFGGAIAAHYAVTHGEKVNSLTLLEPAFTVAYPPLRILFWASLVAVPGLPSGIRERAMSEISGGAEIDMNDPLAAMIFYGTEGYSAYLPQPQLLSDTQIRSLTMPTYVAVAQNHSLAGGSKITNRIKNLQTEILVEIWPDTTHSLPMEAGSRLNKRLLIWWSRL